MMHSIKRNYTLNYKKLHYIKTPLNIWQGRFWDHIIRDELDLAKHYDYIHWNPVNHNSVVQPEASPHTSYLHWFERGNYPKGWGKLCEPLSIKNMHIE